MSKFTLQLNQYSGSSNIGHLCAMVASRSVTSGESPHQIHGQTLIETSPQHHLPVV